MSDTILKMGNGTLPIDASLTAATADNDRTKHRPAGNKTGKNFHTLRNTVAKRRKHAAAVAGSSGQSNNQVTLTIPGPDPANQEAVKYYVFNQTGNIMMSSTDLSSDGITQQVRDVFNEVSVFFAAMTRAISTTINPATGKYYSLYDYNALQHIIDGSGLFVHVTEEDIVYDTNSYGADFSTSLIEGLLGLATGSGELSFAEGMIASIGSAVQFMNTSSSDDNKVANIIFVCEYLLGMPVVSAIVVYCDASQIIQIDQGPCYCTETVTTHWEMHKDTYMFVTPNFIKQYGPDLLSIESDGPYLELVSFLSELVISKPLVTGVIDAKTGAVVTSPLTVNNSYVLTGENFGNDPGKLSFGSGTITVGAWNNNLISFTPTTPVTTAAYIDVFLKANTGTTPDASSPGSYLCK